MKLIDSKWNPFQNANERTYLANTAEDVDLSMVPEDCAIGSAILVVSEGAMYIKNTLGEWQLSGSTEVLA